MLAIEAGKPKEVDCELSDAAGIADFEFKVPLSVYGSSVMLPILKEVATVSDLLHWKVLPAFWLVVNSVVQIIFMKSLFDISKSAASTLDHETCEHLDDWLLAAAVWVFVVVVLTDLQQSIDMAELYCRQIPTVPESKVLRFRDVDGKLVLTQGGFSVAHKVGVFVFVVLPKICYAFFLLVLGVTYLIFSTTNVDVILNCTALVFIMDIDEFIYSFFSLARERQVLEACPPFVVKDAGQACHWYVWRPLSQAFKLCVSCLLVGLTMGLFSRCGYEAPGSAGLHDDVMPTMTPSVASAAASAVATVVGNATGTFVATTTLVQTATAPVASVGTTLLGGLR